MVHQGFQRYGDVEVVNTERLAAYVANGIAPPDAIIDVPAIADGLAAVVTGDPDYTTPLQDLAPWVDLDDPDTFDFAGVLPLDITGVDTTTRTVAMIPTTRDGALPGSARRAARTVAVSALLVGRTTEGVQAGLAWLQRTLHGACDAVEAQCGPAATLEIFTADPGPITATADTAVPPETIVRVHPTDATNPSYGWVVDGGSFDTDAGDATVLNPYPVLPIDGGLSSQTAEGYIDGGGAAGVTTVIDGGGAGPIPPSTALLSAQGTTCTDGAVTITWSLRRASAFATTVQMVLVDDAGVAVEFGPTYTLTDTLTDYEWDLPYGIDYDTWRPGLLVGYPIAVASASFTRYPDASPLDCVAPYRRFLPGAVVTSGPTPVESVDAGCAVLLRVEWVWVIGTPYRYGTTKTVLAGLSSHTDPTLVLPGVSWARQVANPYTLVDDCESLTGWTPFRGADLGLSGGGIRIANGPTIRPAADRAGTIDLSTRRYLIVDHYDTGTSGLTNPRLSLTVGSTTLDAEYLSTGYGDDGHLRSYFHVPNTFGPTATSMRWTSAGYNATRSSFAYIYSIFAATALVQTGDTIAATPWDCAPPAPEASCAADPCAPGFGTPPALPIITDPARPRITTQQVHDMWVCVGPEQVPGNDGVFNISLTADAPIVGARVRVWDDTAGDCTVPDPCAFAYEYLIDYVPQDGVLTINGRDGTFTTLCDGGAVLADASGLIAGDFGGPTKEPVARCNRRYLIRVQWLATYPRTCPDVYTAGQPQGDLIVAVAVTPREG